MANPDGTPASSNMSGVMTLGFFIAILTILLFNYYDTSFFSIILYGVFPAFIYILMSFVIYISKSGTSMGRSFVAGLPTIGTTYLALFISYISYFRIPIASVFAPLFLDSSANIVSQPVQKGGSKKQKGGSCCSPTYSLEGMELQFPTMKGISYGFYLFFAVCFGGVSGLASA